MAATSHGSPKYQISLLVTFEEELAIMNLFSIKGWDFLRVPDINPGYQPPYQRMSLYVPDASQRTQTPAIDSVENTTVIIETSAINNADLTAERRHLSVMNNVNLTHERPLSVESNPEFTVERMQQSVQSNNSFTTENIQVSVENNPTFITEATQPSYSVESNHSFTAASIQLSVDRSNHGVNSERRESSCESDPSYTPDRIHPPVVNNPSVGDGSIQQQAIVPDAEHEHIKSSVENNKENTTHSVDNYVTEDKNVSNVSVKSSATLNAPEDGVSATKTLVDVTHVHHINERIGIDKTNDGKCEDIDISDSAFIENSFFHIPKHIVKGLENNTEILDSTKKLLLELTSELKQFSSSNTEGEINAHMPPGNLKRKKSVDKIKVKTEAVNSSDSKKTSNQVNKRPRRSTRKREVTKGTNVKECEVTPESKTKVTTKKGSGINKEIQSKLRNKSSKKKAVVQEQSMDMVDEATEDPSVDNEDEGGEEVSCEKTDMDSGRKVKLPVVRYEDGHEVRNEVDKHIDDMSLVMLKDDKMKCCMCKESFENEAAFKKHAQFCLSELHNRRGSHTYKCVDCLAYFRQAFTLLRHRHSEVCVPGQKKQPGEFLVCKFCDKKYPSRRRSDYIHHVQTHNNVRPFCCDICGKDFVRWTTLRDHKRTHTGERPFQCSYCPLTFVSEIVNDPVANKLHLRSGPTCCGACPGSKLFAQGGPGLRNHELVRHQNLPKIYVCEKCGASFKLRGRLTAHIKEVHNTTVIYTCEFCHKTFNRKGSFSIHRRIHLNPRDKICEICGKAFTLQARLTGHMKRHRNERSHFCDQCGKGFYTKLNLEDHKRTHSGDKPFSCQICNYHCACYSNTVKHVRTRHPEVKETRKVISNNSMLSKLSQQVSVMKPTDYSTGNIPYIPDA